MHRRGKLTLALDITITDELRREGVARELVNRIQNLRKDSNFEVTDKINIEIENRDEIVDALAGFKDYICNQTLANSITISENVENFSEIEWEDRTLRIKLTRLKFRFRQNCIKVTEKVNKYMQMAIDLAKENAVSAGGGPFGAVIVMNDEVISASSNSVTPDNDPYGPRRGERHQGSPAANSTHLTSRDAPCTHPASHAPCAFRLHTGPG